jgi:hypothetical protein
MAEAVKQVEGTINGAVEAIAELDWYSIFPLWR